MSRKLVAYFSVTGITARVAERLSETIGADIYSIEPEVPYTRKDVEWRNPRSRSALEQKDVSFRPEIEEKRDNMDEYDTVYVGFPIWMNMAPTIINTFLESYDMTGKRIITFTVFDCNDMETINRMLLPSCQGAELITGGIIKPDSGVAELSEWVSGIETD